MSLTLCLKKVAVTKLLAISKHKTITLIEATDRLLKKEMRLTTMMKKRTNVKRSNLGWGTNFVFLLIE
jgi:hypothetical protein